MECVDIAVIGTGPAGLSAAVNAKLRGKSLLWFGSARLSDKVARSERIENYIDLPGVTGEELNEAFDRHRQAMALACVEERITGIYAMGRRFILMADQKQYEARTVILASGAQTLRPIPGERELLGRGVSYCATCDGNLYRGKTIAVVCDTAAMEEEAEFLAGLAETMYYFPLFAGESRVQGTNVQIRREAAAEVLGEKRVQALRLKSGEEIAVDGIFFLKQAVPADVLLNGLQTEKGRIVTDRAMATNIRGCFAAGDCTGRPYQIAKAVGEGNIAAHSAIAYLAEAAE